MRATFAARPSQGGRWCRLAAALLAAPSLAACTGDNLFTGVGVSAGLLGPEVQITAPQNNLGLAVGDSVQVTANVSSAEGVSSVKYTGIFAGGAAAFTEIVVSLPTPQDTTISRYMKQIGTTTGTVRVIVEATNPLGDRGADTVNVIIQ